MSKGKLVEEVGGLTGLKKSDASAAVDAVVKSVDKLIRAGERVTLPGFGTFKMVRKEARQGRNPATGESLTIAARDVIKFTEAKSAR